MTGFCVREMRKEYRGVSRLYAGTAMLFLLAFACLSAVMRAREADARLRLLLIGLDAVVAVGTLGLHLILTDEKNLIKKTPFGEALRALGDPKEIMRQIDESAGKQFDLYSSFALLDEWLIVYYPSPWKYEQKRVCARPVPRSEIRAIEPMGKARGDAEGMRRYRIGLSNGTAIDMQIGRRQEAEALRDWLAKQEQTTL